MYHVGVDVHDYHVHTHGRKEVAVYEVSISAIPVRPCEIEDWVTATEYAMNMVREQHPNADIELAYVKEYNAR